MTREGRQSPWLPLEQPGFRMLWLVTAASAVCLTMHDVAAAWLMTTMTSSPAMVALVQTAGTAPVFLLALPGGALADKVNRHRMLAAIQVWTALVAIGCSVAVLTHAMTPGVLLVLTFCSGTAIALRYPAVAAELPSLVPRSQVSAALALNALAFNTTRIGAPLLAGMLIAGFGSGWVFGLNAAIAATTAAAILARRSEGASAALSDEPLGAAMRSGLQFVRHSPLLCATLARVLLLFVHTSAAVALLPLVARALPGAGAGTFTLLLGAMGTGSVLSVLVVLPRLRASGVPEWVLLLGPLLIALGTFTLALSPWLPLAVLAMVVHGMSLTVTANSLAVLAQSQLPDWVRARGMAIHLCVVMGGSALGAALWGQVASHSSVRAALVAAAASGVACALLARLLPGSRMMTP